VPYFEQKRGRGRTELIFRGAIYPPMRLKTYVRERERPSTHCQSPSLCASVRPSQNTRLPMMWFARNFCKQSRERKKKKKERSVGRGSGRWQQRDSVAPRPAPAVGDVREPVPWGASCDVAPAWPKKCNVSHRKWKKRHWDVEDLEGEALKKAGKFGPVKAAQRKEVGIV